MHRAFFIPPFGAFLLAKAYSVPCPDFSFPVPFMVDSGFYHKETAFRIHMSAATNIDNLFKDAPKIEHQTVYHFEKSSEAAIQLYCSFHVHDILTAVSVILFEGASKHRIYSHRLRLRALASHYLKFAHRKSSIVLSITHTGHTPPPCRLPA